MKNCEHNLFPSEYVKLFDRNINVSFIYLLFYVRYGKTPLLDAISNDHHDIITLLRNCGAHLHGDLKEYGDDLCR